MNVLILSIQFGMGHQMAATAIGEEIKKQDKDAQVAELDLLTYCYPHISRYIFRLFQLLVEHCYGIYNLMYKLSGKMAVDIKPTGITVFKKLEKLMQDYEPDIIVCTIPLCSKSIASYLEKTGCRIPLVTCITDISIHPEWITAQTDAYLAPTREVRDNLIQRGADPEHIFVTGIPVRQQFLDMKNKQLNEEKEVLIMGGGLGIIPNLDELIERLHHLPGVSATIITGKNRRAYEKWDRKYDDIKVLGYTDNISTYIKKADIVITKAGGITLFELIHCEVPLFVIHPFLEQEVNNAKYAEEQGIAKVVWDKSADLINILERFLSDEEQWRKIRCNMHRVKHEISDCSVGEAIRTVAERMTA